MWMHHGTCGGSWGGVGSHRRRQMTSVGRSCHQEMMDGRSSCICGCSHKQLRQLLCICGCSHKQQHRCRSNSGRGPLPQPVQPQQRVIRRGCTGLDSTAAETFAQQGAILLSPALQPGQSVMPVPTRCYCPCSLAGPSSSFDCKSSYCCCCWRRRGCPSPPR